MERGARRSVRVCGFVLASAPYSGNPTESSRLLGPPVRTSLRVMLGGVLGMTLAVAVVVLVILTTTPELKSHPNMLLNNQQGGRRVVDAVTNALAHEGLLSAKKRATPQHVQVKPATRVQQAKPKTEDAPRPAERAVRISISHHPAAIHSQPHTGGAEAQTDSTRSCPDLQCREQVRSKAEEAAEIPGTRTERVCSSLEGDRVHRRAA